MGNDALKIENAVYLENSFSIKEVVSRSAKDKTTYNLHLINHFEDSSGLVAYRKGINLDSRILGIRPDEFEKTFGSSEPESLSERSITLGFAIPYKYGHVEHHGDSNPGDIEIASFERKQLYIPCTIRDEQTDPLTFVEIRTNTMGQELFGHSNFSLNLVFGPEKFDELREYFSQRGSHYHSGVVHGDRLNRAPLRIKTFELLKD